MAQGLRTEQLGDVAQATLYRHLNQLEGGGIVEVTAERKVRGVVERTYGVVLEGASEEMSRVVHGRLDNGPEAGRRRRLLTTIVMPDDRGR